MKSKLLVVTGLFISCHLFSQTEIWTHEDYSVGANVAGFPGGTAGTIPTMSEVIELPTGTFRMYLNTQYNFGQKHCISYAESPDAINWTMIDTVFCGPTDTTARNFILGGPSIIHMQNGQYRLYYRCTQKFSVSPNYHVRSAISSDGINFTQEGIRIDIKPYLPTSPFYLVGHGSYYQLSNGSFAGIFSGNPDTSTLIAPSSLIHGTSTDGLTWGNYTFLYQNHHDPIVIKKNSTYHLYAMDLAKKMVKATSSDGLTWPATTDSVSFIDSAGTPMLINNTKRIGDVGGLTMPNGDIYLYTNYSGNNPSGPSKNIIRFTLSNPGVNVSENNSFSLLTNVFPVPVTENTVIEFEKQEKFIFELTDNLGRVIYSQKHYNTGKINIGRIPMQNGIYFYRIITENGFSSGKIIK